MIKLTKEECLEVLESSEYLEVVIKDERAREVFHDNFNGTTIYKTFEQLIKEHFDNTPLKFEELKEGMWVWIDGYDKYFKIKELFTMHNVDYVRLFNENGDEFFTKYDSKKFFAREVKDER